jgi:hypothetical protein
MNKVEQYDTNIRVDALEIFDGMDSLEQPFFVEAVYSYLHDKYKGETLKHMYAGSDDDTKADLRGKVLDDAPDNELADELETRGYTVIRPKGRKRKTNTNKSNNNAKM